MEIKSLQPGDDLLVREAGHLFDHPIDLAATAAFLSDERHHLLLAYLDGEPAGFVTAIELLHPDKPRPEMFIYELGVAPDYRRQGVATSLLRALQEICREHGCGEMFVLTEPENTAAMRTYPRPAEHGSQIRRCFPGTGGPIGS